MSNRRTGRKKAGKARAPQDAAASFIDTPGTPRTAGVRSVWQWLALGAKLTLGLALIVGAVGSLAWGVHRYAQTTPRFSIVKIEIEGTRRLGREDVLGAAQVKKGDNLFAFDVERAESSLLESPWISSARITRQLPGTIQMEIAERDVLALAILGGKTFLVDQEGQPFKVMGSGDPHDLPVVTGLSVAALSKDRRAELERLRGTLSLLRKYEKLSLSQSFPAQEVHLEPSGSAVLMVGAKGTSLHLGPPPWKQKLLRAERVLQKTRRSGGIPSVVFLDNEAHPERVVVRVR